MKSKIAHIKLQAELDQKKADFLSKADTQKIQTYDEGVKAVEQAGVLERALKTGEKAKDFTLHNALGKSVSLKQYLDKGPVVLTWYRGGWCPYCNLTLRALQEALPAFLEAGATLLALTPELPDNSLNTSQKQSLSFEVLTDLENAVARQYGLVFELTLAVHAYYRNAFSLLEYNGHDRPELPLAATYVIDQTGTIRWHFLDAEYRNRAEPQEILSAIQAL